MVVQSSSVGSAVNAEKAAFIQALDAVLNDGLEVGCIATDGHTGVLIFIHIQFTINTSINHQKIMPFPLILGSQQYRTACFHDHADAIHTKSILVMQPKLYLYIRSVSACSDCQTR